MSGLIRILSDVHFGDRASRAARIAQLEPLTEGADELIFNGDTLDTRAGPRPAHTAECRAAIQSFAKSIPGRVRFLSGNHDPDLSPDHAAELAAGRVVATHGDVVFDDIVPWGRDAPIIRARISNALQLRPRARDDLEERFAIWREVAAGIPQRHQSEPHGLKYTLRFAADTVWPPLRIFRIWRAWRVHAPWMATFAGRHWPKAKIIVIGHTHRPGIAAMPDGRVVINTGSFCPPLGGLAVDVSDASVRVQRIDYQSSEFRLGTTWAEFPL